MAACRPSPGVEELRSAELELLAHDAAKPATTTATMPTTGHTLITDSLTHRSAAGNGWTSPAVRCPGRAGIAHGAV